VSTFFESVYDFTAPGLTASDRWLRAAGWMCTLGALCAGLSGWLRWRASGANRAAPARPNLASRSAIGALFGAIALTFVSVWHRGVEVNHFPSQNMSEVLVMFGFATLVSIAVLHFVMKLREFSQRWAIADDALLALVLVSALLVFFESESLPNAQRDLPPALQSYWFAPHLSALIFSYASLGIAGLICTVYFSMRFWFGVYSGGRTLGSQLLVFGLLWLVPFTQLVTIPVFLITGLCLWGGRKRGLPSADAFKTIERTMELVSYRAFMVGIPFLTAGLYMGAFWAQEAWANYWGWDSKENTALVTWLVYVAYLHVRMLGGYRGERSMAVLLGGALSVFVTFQLFGYMPDSQKNSLHNYTNFDVPAKEGQQGQTRSSSDEQAKAESEHR
jgi:cytochrome c-type biogenesis protein CcsB